jgi:hypothetical protein
MAEPTPVPVPVATEEQGPWTQYQTPAPVVETQPQETPQDTGPWTQYQTPTSDQQSDEIPTPAPNATALGEATAAISGMGKGAWDINKYRANDWKPVADETPYGVQKYLNKQLKVPSNTGISIPRGTVSLEDLGKATGIDTRTMQEVQAALAKAKGAAGTMEPIIEMVQGVPVQTGTRMVGGTPPINLSPYVKVSELEKRVPALNDFLVKNYKPIESIKKRVKAPAVLGLSTAEAQAAFNRAKEGDTGRAILDTAGAIGAPIAAARFLPKGVRILGGLAAAAAPVVEATAPQKKAAGGLMHLAGGGGKLGAAAEIAQRAAHEFANQKPGRMTDWLQHHIDKYIVPTQADRMGGVGGPSFSANSLALPEYHGKVWGSGNEPTASTITNLAKDERFGGPENQIFVPLLGHQNQHKSNQIVFNKLMDEFYKDPKSLTPELKAQINAFMESGGGIEKKTGMPYFTPFSGFDVADKDLVNFLGQSFENRGLIAQHAFGGERLGGKKAQIIPYQQMLDELADPTVKGAPTFAVGPRAFQLTGGVHPEARPDLNAAFPHLLEGTDLNVTNVPTPNNLVFRDFQNQWREHKGKTEPLVSGKLPEPGYYENTLGYKVNKDDPERIYPRQKVDEQLLDTMYEAGHKTGGHINFMDHLAGGGVIDGYAPGGKVGALEMLAKKLMPLAEREANKAKFLDPSAIKNVMYHGTAADISQFRPKQVGATFLTASPNFAGGFADSSEHYLKQQLQNSLSSAELAKLNDQAYKLSRKTGESATDLYHQMLKERLPTGQNVMPVHVQATNPFDYDDPEHIANLRQYLQNNNSSRADAIADAIHGKGSWDVIEMPETQNAIKKMGHDSFYAQEGGNKNLGVYDPNKIKSAIGNEGTYDITNPDITKKRGGKVKKKK